LDHGIQGSIQLNYGEAGDLIIAAQEIQLQNPVQYDDLLSNEQIRYPATADGYRNFKLLEKRFSKLRENKKKLLSKLLGAMEREVKTKSPRNGDIKMPTLPTTYTPFGT
jgi:chromatin segregation and condensation protein Rec8/ScpA/Scc1 (kleisin family)